jgi:hypothetical protein
MIKVSGVILDGIFTILTTRYVQRKSHFGYFHYVLNMLCIVVKKCATCSSYPQKD